MKLLCFYQLHNKIDKKGRVSVPRNFRTYLDLEGGLLIYLKVYNSNALRVLRKELTNM